MRHAINDKAEPSNNSVPSLPAESDIRAFVYDWYRKLDIHAPVEQFLPALSDTQLKMVFPEATLEGVDAFIAWYKGGSKKFKLPGVINLFFDEAHELKWLAVSIADGHDATRWRADVTIVVKWEARRWKPSAAKSEYLGFDAWQRWVLKLNPKTGKPWIEQYIVDALEPLQGSAPL